MLIAGRHAQGPHNEGPYDQPDPGLTEVGFGQASELGVFLNRLSRPVAQVATSPMLRCLLTCITALDEMGYEGPVILDPALRERMSTPPHDMGSPRSALAEYIKTHPEIFKGRKIDFSLMTEEIWYCEEYESHTDLDKRLITFNDRYVQPAANTDEITLVFTHGGLLRRKTGRKEVENCEALIIQPGASRRIFTPTLITPHYKPTVDPLPGMNFIS